MELLTLRTQLETALANQLGQYRLHNGYTVPAICVRQTGDTLPAGTTVTGIECVLLAEPTRLVIPQYQSPPVMQTWTVLLVDWEGTADFTACLDSLLVTWPGLRATPAPTPAGQPPYHQIRVTIRTN